MLVFNARGYRVHDKNIWLLTNMKFVDLKYLKRFLDLISGVKAIMFLRLVGGLYSTVSHNKYINLAVKNYCIFFTIYVICASIPILQTLSTSGIILGMIRIFQHAVTVGINLIFGGEYFMIFFHNVRNVDISLGVKPTCEALFTRILCISLLIFQFSVIFIICNVSKVQCQMVSSEIVALTVISTMSCLSNLTKVLMFEMILYRVKTLRKLIGTDLSTIRRFEGNEVKAEIYKRVTIYNNLLKTLFQTKIPMKPLVSILLMYLYNDVVDEIKIK